MNTITLRRVKFMPRQLESEILFFSEEFGVAGHLCPCGCGTKIITPIGPTDWTFTEVNGKPTLFPSIGNWQIPCRSHYWIIEGAIVWSYRWSDEQIKAGQRDEEKQRKSYFKKLAVSRKKQHTILKKIQMVL